jgi:hypothetical protein
MKGAFLAVVRGPVFSSSAVASTLTLIDSVLFCANLNGGIVIPVRKREFLPIGTALAEVRAGRAVEGSIAV